MLHEKWVCPGDDAISQGTRVLAWLGIYCAQTGVASHASIIILLGVHLVQSSLSFITCMILCMRPIVRKRSLRSNVTLPRLVVKNVSATLEKMLPCYGLRFAGEASSNLKSHSTKFGHYPCSHFANTTPAVHVHHVHHHHQSSIVCDYSLASLGIIVHTR